MATSRTPGACRARNARRVAVSSSPLSSTNTTSNDPRTETASSVNHAGSPAPIPITYNLSTMRVLILGGTQEARELQAALPDSTLALKRTTTFGGAEGLER